MRNVNKTILIKKITSESFMPDSNSIMVSHPVSGDFIIAIKGSSIEFKFSTKPSMNVLFKPSTIYTSLETVLNDLYDKYKQGLLSNDPIIEFDLNAIYKKYT